MGWSGFRWGGVLTSSEAARFGVSRVRKTLPMGTQSSWSFRHHHITGDEQTIAKANRLKGALEQLACRYGTEMCQPVIAREGHKMKITGLLVSHKRRGHNRSSDSHISPRCGASTFKCGPDEKSRNPHLKSEMWGTPLSNVGQQLRRVEPTSQKRDVGHPRLPNMERGEMWPPPRPADLHENCRRTGPRQLRVILTALAWGTRTR